ncbi:cytochrome o ubiquinol oxidase subunit I [Ruegeria sp. Ofav3-42]|uniref:cytochrome o ubiquinol oxidase subunit I n=1 Tax=Ruegeria sp. Ofav3-42 TaxID=2917759 RepID=UPI001EF5A870|nr:cytochrome o ubiquinol oxidase subunit I [Ruegeria sp. Ofav3-42]MCG7521840.1 cytochrome o ubiquinol oxidase subunit I [Ruegeria sp. Ofav3-42]
MSLSHEAADGIAHVSGVDPFWGKLSWGVFPFYEPIVLVTFIVVVLGGLAVVGALTYYRLWGYLWKEWFTSIDHKKIGIMYMVLGLIMLLRGFADALLMRGHQAIAASGGEGYLNAHHYDQIFTAHGVIMIFFVAMPFVTGFMNYVMPLQIGARDVAFPFLNNLSLWLTISGAVLIMLSLFVGEFSTAGWLAYAPFSGLEYSPSVGMDYYLWSLNIAGIGTTLSGINLVVTIIKMRAPGMTLMKMPVFVWTTLCTNILIVVTFPVLAATLALLTADRYLGTHFFTNDLGGNPMMYVNLIWIWGHPEVYILILPIFGIFSEIVPTFTGKRLFGYTSMVYATCVIMVLSYIVWLHHFFTMGAGANVNAFFGITTMIISIPTGAKIFNWLFTMYKGRIRFETPMLWVMGFMLTFVIGGMTGVLLAVPPADYVLHNSLFLIAHFHNVIIGGVVFGIFAGIIYWWPKAFGFKLEPFWGNVSFWCWLIGFYLAFMPLYVLGLMGVTRRISQFETTFYSVYFVIALVGALFVAAGIAAFLVQIYVSIRNRDALRDVTGDPWNGRTLEWSTSSPPPYYNFAFTPRVHELDAFTQMKREGFVRPTEGFVPIHMPRYTATGVVMAGFMTVMGFALIWHIWWLAAVSFAATLVYGIGHTFNYDRDYYVPADEVKDIEDQRTQLLAGAAE